MQWDDINVTKGRPMVQHIISAVAAIAISSIIVFTCSCDEDDSECEEQAAQEQQKCVDDVIKSFHICVAHIPRAKDVDVKAEIEGCEMQREARLRACCLPQKCE